MEKIVMSVSEG